MQEYFKQKRKVVIFVTVVLCETQNEIFGIIKVDAVYTAMH